MSESVVKSELESIYSTDGALTPASVLDRARSESSPLHGLFEWDDTVAGEKFRLVQAQKLITKVKVTYRAPSGEKQTVRRWHAVQAPTQDWSYKPLDVIATDDIATKILLADMKRDFEAFQRRYENVAGYLDLIRGALKSDAA